MIEGKWIAGLAPELPVSAAARLALAARAAAVAHFLPLAAHRAAEDDEHVHQLRVGTRRAAAALRVFRDCVKSKPHDRAKRQLRSLRRAAGEARDGDVFRKSLAAQRAAAPADTPAAFDVILGIAVGERAAAQARLAEAAAESRFDPAALVAAVRPPKRSGAEPAFAELAAVQLAALFGAFSAGVESNPDSPAELHRLRILGKRLRYAIELFAPCFAPPLKDAIYPAVEAAQEILGELQDAAVGAARLDVLREWIRQFAPQDWPRLATGLEGWADELQRQVPAHRERFAAWREEWQSLAAAHPLEALAIRGEWV